MSTKAIFVKPGGGYQNVVVGHSEAPAPGAGEITVRLHANSLNYHDFAVVSGMWGPSEERIPMADGAGEVIAVGADVSEFKVGDSVVSTFFPEWIDGTPLLVHDYWDRLGAVAERPPLDWMRDIATRVKSRFFTMDVALREDGGWTVIELGDGQVAGLPGPDLAGELYRGLRRSLLDERDRE